MAEVDAIRVGIRARPFGKQAGQKRPWITNDRSLQCTAEKTSKQGGKVQKAGRQLDFDHVWDEEVPQGTHTIHNEFTRPVVDSVMNGYHGTVAMYGQTGSGKTFTMFGDKKAGIPGLVDLCVEQLFESIAQQTDKDYMVRVAYIEIYNESVRDLLNPSARPLKVRHSADTGFFVDSQEVVVTDATQVDALRDTGDEVRSVGVTNMNAHSSRSHTIFRLIVEGQPKGAGTTSVAHLNLVDLAGSERVGDTGAEGVRLKEAININKSLSTLSQIVRMLSEEAQGKKRGHLPFRDSKLTQILQPALGGNSKTAFICTVCLAQRFVEECKRTLAFAQTAKSVKNEVMVNEVVNEKALLAEYKAEINKLKAELKAAKVATEKAPTADTGASAEDKVKLQKAQAALSSEKNARKRAEAQQEELQAKITFMESMVIGGAAEGESAADAALSPQVVAFSRHQATEPFLMKIGELEARQAAYESRIDKKLQQERSDHAKALADFQGQLLAAGSSTAEEVAFELAATRDAADKARKQQSVLLERCGKGSQVAAADVIALVSEVNERLVLMETQLQQQSQAAALGVATAEARSQAFSNTVDGRLEQMAAELSEVMVTGGGGSDSSGGKGGGLADSGADDDAAKKMYTLMKEVERGLETRLNSIEEAAWDESMKVEDKFEELQASIALAAAAAVESTVGSASGGGDSAAAESTGGSAIGRGNSARDDAQDRAAEDMDLRISHLEGLVGHFEAERQQGTFDVIKSVEENLYLIESTMEDKTNELERILYSAIGGPAWGNVPPLVDQVNDFLDKTNLKALSEARVQLPEATPPRAVRAPGVSARRSAPVSAVRQEPAKPPPQFMTRATLPPHATSGSAVGGSVSPAANGGFAAGAGSGVGGISERRRSIQMTAGSLAGSLGFGADIADVQINVSPTAGAAVNEETGW